VKRCAIYTRVSTGDQHTETQRLDLRAMAAQRGLEIVTTYKDVISGAKARRPGPDAMMREARSGKFAASATTFTRWSTVSQKPSENSSRKPSTINGRITQSGRLKRYRFWTAAETTSLSICVGRRKTEQTNTTRSCQESSNRLSRKPDSQSELHSPSPSCSRWNQLE
jgi:hypothetical protein